MSADAIWQEGNARYLATALTSLRLRLERMANGNGDETDSLQLSDREIALCESQMAPPPALVVLAQRLGLSRFEQQVLLLCAAMELDTRIAELCARAQNDAARQHPTFALALALFDDAAWDVMSPERPLRYWRLIDIHQSQARTLTTSALRADERVVNYIKGLNHLDERLMAMVIPFNTGIAVDALQPSQQASVDIIIHAWNVAAPGPQWPAVQLLGTDAPSKQLVAHHAAAHFGRRLYRVGAEALPPNPTDLDALARLWERECALLPIALLIEIADGPGVASAQASLNRFLSRSEGLFFVDVREPLSQLGRARVAVDVAKPTVIEQRDAWDAALSGNVDGNSALLSAQFNLDIATIRRIADSAVLEARSGDQELSNKLWDACKAAVRPGLDALAHRIDAKATWDDIVLPGEQLVLLQQICAQVRCRSRVYEEWGFARKMNRGLGISALFAGDERHRQDDGRRSHRQRPAAQPLPHRLVHGRQQVHRRDREEPAALVRRRRGWRRDPVLRRSRRAVRQTQRGQGQPRPLRQHRDQLPVAAHGGLSRAWRSWRPT